MEMVSKGKVEKGSVWVASRVPEGYVGSTANQGECSHLRHWVAATAYSIERGTMARSRCPAQCCCSSPPHASCFMGFFPLP